MAEYAGSLKKLVDVGMRAGIPITVAPYDGSSCSVDIDNVFGRGLADEIRQHGYFEGFHCRWTGNDMAFYGLDELSARQREYFQDGDVTYRVVAENDSDPVAISADGRLNFARHGVGVWKFDRIAEDFPQFLTALGAMIEFFHVTHDKNIYTDNWEFDPSKKREILEILGEILPAELVKNCFTFFWRE